MSLKKLISILFLLVISEVTLNAVTYEPLPNRPYWRGFYYCLDMADYPYLLHSNMPYKILQGYIVADSVVKSMPSITYFSNPINSLNLRSDTAQYIYKYWYLLNEYDPLRFYAFLKRKYPEAKNGPSILHSELKDRTYMDYSNSLYARAGYILHVYVNNTVVIDTADTTPMEGVRVDSNGNYVPDTSILVQTETTAYCKVLDALKGEIYPSLANAIFYNGELSSEGDGIVGNAYITPQQTDIVFSYRDNWSRGDIPGHAGSPLFDKNGERWIKPNREYIVFLGFLGMDAIGSWDPVGSIHKVYYSIIPCWGPGSYNMYPIEDGYVIDESNALEFGKKVPVDIFKQNIRNKIDEIKNYGE